MQTAAAEVVVAPGNRAAYDVWNGPEGAFWTDREALFDRSVAAYDRALLAAARIEPADRVLDVGCGTGSVTRRAARAAHRGSVVGIDLSAPMLRRAREHAAADGLRDTAFVHGDAQVHPFDEASFDVVLSRTGTMFFADLVAAFGNLHGALRPGGRLAMLVWQPVPRNRWFVEWATACLGDAAVRSLPTDGPPPFRLADPDRVRAVLSAAGFADVELTGHEEPMWFGPDVETASGFVRAVCAGVFGLSGFEPAARDAATAALRRSVEAHAGRDGVTYASAAWVVTANRRS